MTFENGGDVGPGTVAALKSQAIKPAWDKLIPEEEWLVYSDAITSLRGAGIDFLIGGGFGLAVYTRRLRDTKDIDFFVVPEDCPRAIDALTQAGFADYYPKLPYDRGWIYRSTRGGYIVDLIFQMANRRAEVDAEWFAHGRPVLLKGELLRAVGPEELIWQKLYVLQRDRCDWPDILNLLASPGTKFDWEYLRERLGEDVPLLRGVLDVFSWLAPDDAARLRAPAWAGCTVPLSEAGHETMPRRRIDLLDSRAWFRSTVAADQFLEV